MNALFGLIFCVCVGGAESVQLQIVDNLLETASGAAG